MAWLDEAGEDEQEETTEEAPPKSEETTEEPTEEPKADGLPKTQAELDALIAAAKAEVAPKAASKANPPAAGRLPARSTQPKVSINKMSDEERYNYWKKEVLPELTKSGNHPAEDLREMATRQ